MGAWIDDFKERFKDNNNFQNLLNYLEKFPVPEEFSLDICYRNVMILMDFMEIIEKNSNQLKYLQNVECIKRNVKPSTLLGEYILLEISTFYTKIHLMKEKGKNLPEPPEYWKVLKDFRDLMPAHRDKEYKLKTLADYTFSIKKLDSMDIFKIVEEFIEYYKKMKNVK